MHIIVTVDTEADDQWDEHAALSVGNVFALPRFQRLCERYGIAPTYFVTYEVASDARASALLREWQDLGKAEVGAHLHPWTTPPVAPGEEHVRAFPSELSDETLQKKLTALTEKVEATFGKRPTSYRAGRWGFDMRQAAFLKELGYIADSSVTPGISWRETRGVPGGAGGPDFTNEPVMPHMLNDRVLEIPMTVVRTRLLRRRRWLRIFEKTTERDLVKVLAVSAHMDLPAAVFMIHSSELVAGESPYVKDEAALAHVYARLEELFAFCKKKGITSATVSAFARSYV
ncbi:hypothetical protein HY418_02015 [Candidatus Kaiserbacteria bacterium]|nr:hypothetical protein [Candidatus Kaiserbacteria bacterium]